MNLLTKIYLNSTKKQFYKYFKPLSRQKKSAFLISMPKITSQSLKVLGTISGLKKLGTITLLSPEDLKNICNFLKLQNFEVIYYKKPLDLFGREYNILKQNLETKHFDFLIEFNNPANCSLPYLVNAEKRICFSKENALPYYNIIIKDDPDTIIDFFKVKKQNLKSFFAFRLKEKKNVLRKFNKKRPLLFVNDKDCPSWTGDKIMMNKEITISDPEFYRMLFIADAYCGIKDEVYECARLFNKKIIEL